MENINIEQLSKSSEELMELINETNNVIRLPQSHLKEDFQTYVISRYINRAAPIISPTGYLAAYAGASGIDFIRNTLAKNKARQALLGYYQELVAKNGLLIKAQQNIIKELEQCQNKTSSEVQILNARLAELTAIIERMAALRSRVEM